MRRDSDSDTHPKGGDAQAVSPVPASIPSADTWRLDSPPYGKRPIWQYVWLQGEKEHSGDLWFRQGWGTATIRPNEAPDSLLGYRRADIERICRDYGIDLWSARVVAWLPMLPPAALNAGMRPALAPCDDGAWAASAMSAGTAETAQQAQARRAASAAPEGGDAQ